MAKCPYAPHRLVLTSAGYCQRCDGDLRLYAAIRWLPELLFNDAHRLAHAGDDNGAMLVLERAISLRAEFPEAQILISFLESRRSAPAGAATREQVTSSGAFGISKERGEVPGERIDGEVTQEVLASQAHPQPEDSLVSPLPDAADRARDADVLQLLKNYGVE